MYLLLVHLPFLYQIGEPNMSLVIFNHIDNKMINKDCDIIIEALDHEYELKELLEDNLDSEWIVDSNLNIAAIEYLSSLVDRQNSIKIKKVKLKDLINNNNLIVSPIGKKFGNKFSNFTIKSVDIFV